MQERHRETIPARAPWSRIIRRGETLRIIDTHGQQAVDFLFLLLDQPAQAGVDAPGIGAGVVSAGVTFRIARRAVHRLRHQRRGRPELAQQPLHVVDVVWSTL